MVADLCEVPMITLVRHGQPEVDWTPLLTAAQFRKWTANYDVVSLDPSSRPDQALLQHVSSARNVFCSTLRRSQETCRLTSALEFRENPVFDEVRLAVPPIPLLRMSPYHWAKVAMYLLRRGWGRRAMLGRAIEAAKVLSAASNRDASHSVLFGHGTMNRYILAELTRNGWRCTRQSPTFGSYWGWIQLVAYQD